MSHDQAENLRELIRSKNKCKTIFFMSGKERVGQTMIITNLATLLSENEYKTLILDSGAGFFTTDVLFNIVPKYGVKSVINNDEPISNKVVSINDNLNIVYLRTVFEEIKTSEDMLIKLQKYLDKLKKEYDFILVDLEEVHTQYIKSIIDYNTKLLFTLNSEDLECLKKTYAMIKDIELYTDIRQIDIIINKVKNESLANDFYERLKIAADKFLGIKVENIGYISDDSKVMESLKEQTPIITLYNESKVSDEFKKIFSHIILN